MALPPISRPSVVWSDLKAFFATRRKHQLLFALISLAIPTYFVIAFTFHTVEKQYRPPPVIFVENWRAGRTIAEIQAQQKIDQQVKKLGDAKLEARRQKRMAQARELDRQMDALGM